VLGGESDAQSAGKRREWVPWSGFGCPRACEEEGGGEMAHNRFGGSRFAISK